MNIYISTWDSLFIVIFFINDGLALSTNVMKIEQDPYFFTPRLDFSKFNSYIDQYDFTYSPIFIKFLLHLHKHSFHHISMFSIHLTLSPFPPLFILIFPPFQPSFLSSSFFNSYEFSIFAHLYFIHYLSQFQYFICHLLYNII